MGLHYSKEMPDENEGRFSYNYLNQHLKRTNDVIESEDGLYIARILPDNQEFIAINNVRYNTIPRLLQQRDVRIFYQYGLKFHISLPEWDRGKFKKGWGIVKDVLLRHQVAEFKVIRKSYRMSDNPPQRGKDVTIYANRSLNITKQHWLQIIEEITQELTNNGIPPGYRPPRSSVQERGAIREEKVAGSNYVSYRYDNPECRWPRFDPCSPAADFNVNVANQLPIKDWEDSDDQRFSKCCNIM